MFAVLERVPGWLRGETAGPEGSEELGRKLGELAEPGDVLTLHGGLGAGKTTLTRGLALGLGHSPEEVSIPTFVIQHIHEGAGRLPLYHFDLYRLGDPDELFELGAEDFFWGQGVTVLEWPGLAEGMLPPNRLHLQLTLDPADPERRAVELQGSGSWAARLDQLRP